MADPAKTRVYHIWTPNYASSDLRILVLGVGIVFGGMLGYGIFVAVLGLISWQWGSSDVGRWAVVAAAALGMAAAALCVYWLGTYPRRRVAKKNAIRLSRLERLAKNDCAVERLPHRMVELRLMQKPLNHWLVRSFHIPPGVVVIANGLRRILGPSPEENAVAFEPIEMPEKLQDLVLLNLQQQCPALATELNQSDSYRVSAWKRVKYRLCWASTVIGTIFLPVFGGVRAWRSHSTEDVVLWLAVACTPVASVVAGIMNERQWFLISGALVHRSSPFYLRRSVMRFYRPEDCGLFIDARSGEGFVIADGEAEVFPCHGSSYWPVVAGWISTARRPTRAELDGLIGR